VRTNDLVCCTRDRLYRFLPTAALKPHPTLTPSTTQPCGPQCDSEHVTQPGYDALADRYAEMFPGPYQSPIEQHAVAAFVEKIHSPGVVVDVGCGLGHVTADLHRRGLDVIIDMQRGVKLCDMVPPGGSDS
jgi:hypothetical protein